MDPAILMGGGDCGDSDDSDWVTRMGEPARARDDPQRAEAQARLPEPAPKAAADVVRWTPKQIASK